MGAVPIIFTYYFSGRESNKWALSLLFFPIIFPIIFPFKL